MKTILFHVILKQKTAELFFKTIVLCSQIAKNEFIHMKVDK